MGLLRIAGKKYEEIIDEYGTGIKQLAYSYVKDNQLAEDITQETFLRCFTKRNQFKGESSVKTWLYRIAINLCKDYLKSAAHRNEKADDNMEMTTVNVSPSAEYIALHKENGEAVADLVLSLPVRYREVVILFYFKDFNVAETAGILELPENTVKTRLRKSRELLREGMSKSG